MKIAKFGHVIITPETIRIEDWLMTPEPGDPPEATTNEMVAALATAWALQRLQDALEKESVKAMLRAGQRLKATQSQKVN